MAYPLSTQDSWPRFLAPRSRAIWGRATLTMNRSRLAKHHAGADDDQHRAGRGLGAGRRQDLHGTGGFRHGTHRRGLRSITQPTTVCGRGREGILPKPPQLVPVGPGRFAAEADPEWTIVGKPNGGSLLAMLGRAAVSVSAHPHVIAASAHYLHPPDPGPVVIVAELLRRGRTASQVRARMSQDGQACVEALVTTSRLAEAAVPYWDKGLPAVGQVPFDECVRLNPPTPDGNRVAILEQIDVRLEPGSMGFTAGRPSGTGELRGWLALPARRGVRPDLPPVRRRCLPAGDLRDRVLGLGPHPGADRLRPCPARSRSGACPAARPAHRRPAGR